ADDAHRHHIIYMTPPDGRRLPRAPRRVSARPRLRARRRGRVASPPPVRPQLESSGSPLVRGPPPTRSCLVSPAPAGRAAYPVPSGGGVRTVAARSAGV